LQVDRVPNGLAIADRLPVFRQVEVNAIEEAIIRRDVREGASRQHEGERRRRKSHELCGQRSHRVRVSAAPFLQASASPHTIDEEKLGRELPL
jgi:hypothetical protein